jgi:4-amino-4-deoxy-L-arabinose transferase-like glycosyltransferase
MITDKKLLFSYLCSSVFICGSTFFLLCFRLGDRDLWASHEARAAQDAQRILDIGDWVLPRLFDDQPELQKPPLYYWMAAACGWLRGGRIDALTVRLPAALAGIATVLAVYTFLASRRRPVAGLLASVILLTAQHFTWIARTARIDVPLTFTVSGAILSLWLARSNGFPRRAAVGWGLAGSLFMAGGVLLKGPLGVVLPAAVLISSAFAERHASPPSARQPVSPPSLAWASVLALALAAPWFVAAHLRTGGDFTRVFIWYHNVQRAAGGAEALAKHPWWFYGPRFAFDFLPWSLLLPLALWRTYRCPDPRADRVSRLGLVWFLTVVLLLSASRFKRADYLLPAYPGAALWLGCVGERAFLSWRSPRCWQWLAVGTAAVLGAAMLGWGVFLHVAVPRLDAEHDQQSFAAAIRAVAPVPEQVLLFRVEDHLLAYHLGRPLNTFLEWENLDVWAGRPGRHHILLPADCAAVWRQYISSGELEEVLRHTDRTDRRRPRDLVLMRTRPKGTEQPTDLTDARADRPPARQQGADQRAAAGLQPGGRPGADR